MAAAYIRVVVGLVDAVEPGVESSLGYEPPRAHLDRGYGALADQRVGAAEREAEQVRDFLHRPEDAILDAINLPVSGLGNAVQVAVLLGWCLLGGGLVLAALVKQAGCDGAEPVAAVEAVVGEGLAGPVTRDEAAAAGVAEGLSLVDLPSTGTRHQVGPSAIGLHAVEEPVRAPLRARQDPQFVPQPLGVFLLG